MMMNNHAEELIDAILKDERDELKFVSTEKLNQLSDRIWSIGMDRQTQEGLLTQIAQEAQDMGFYDLSADEFVYTSKLTPALLEMAKTELEELERQSDEAFLIRADMDRKLENL